MPNRRHARRVAVCATRGRHGSPELRSSRPRTKKLNTQIKELKGGGGAVSTSTAGAHDEEASVTLDQEVNKWSAEFERLEQEKPALTNARDDLQRRLNGAEADMARG